MSGPLFEPGAEGVYDSIARMDGCPDDYLQQELKCAKALFTNLGVKDKFFNEFIFEQTPTMAAKKLSIGSTQRAQRMFNEAGDHKITYPKVRMVFLLGMSGKPSWDARCWKPPRLGARAAEGKRSATHPVHYTPDYILKRMRKDVKKRRQEIQEQHAAEELVSLGERILNGELNYFNIHTALGRPPPIRNRDFKDIPLDPNAATTPSHSRHMLHARRVIPLNGNQRPQQQQQLHLEPLQFQPEESQGNPTLDNYDMKGV